MKPASLARWQERMEMTQAEAAAALGLPLGTYRGIVQGRRYASGLPEWLMRLMWYAENPGKRAPAHPAHFERELIAAERRMRR